MTCCACDRAAIKPTTGRFNAGCFECSARAIAGEPLFFETAASETITPAYRARLQAVFGSGWKDGHAAVRKWADLIAKAKQQAGNP